MPQPATFALEPAAVGLGATRLPTLTTPSEQELGGAPSFEQHIEAHPSLKPTPAREPAISLPFDPSQPDSLRKAILCYEILGKPVALRGPGEHLAF